MKKNVRKYIASFCACLSLTSCQDKDPYFFLNPKLPIAVPFSLDKAGNKASIDFWIVPGKEKKIKTYMVSWSYYMKSVSESRDYQLFDFIRRSQIPLKVKVFYVNGQTETRVFARDDDDFHADFDMGIAYLPPTEEQINKSIAHLAMKSWGSGTRDSLVVAFHPKEYGHYRAEVETVQDMPDFAGVKSELIVQNLFNAGE